MNDSDFTNKKELKEIEFSKLTVGEIYSSKWSMKENSDRFNQFTSRKDQQKVEKK